MRNEIPIKQKETNKDDSSFDKEDNVRILEMSLVAYNKSHSSVKNNQINKSKQSDVTVPFSNIFKDKDILNDGDIFY